MTYGFAGHIGIGKETIWGTAVAASEYIKALSESMPVTIDRFDTVNIHGGYYEPDDEAGIQRIAGEIVAAAHPETLGYLLAGAMGQTSVTSLASDLAETAFALRQSEVSSLASLPPYTLEVYRDTFNSSAQQYAGIQFNSLQLQYQPNADVRATANLIGKSQADIAATTPSFPGSPTGVFNFSTVSLSIGGAANVYVEAFNIQIQNNLEGIGALNNGSTIERIRRSNVPLVTFGGTAAFEDTTEYQNFLSQTEQAFVINCTKADSFRLLIDMPRCVYTAFPLGMPGRERLTVGFEGKARYQTSSANTILALLTAVQSNF